MITGRSIWFLKSRLDFPDESVLTSASDVIRAGGVIVYPTDTVYGIGADAWNAVAVRKVIAAKKRGEGKPILTLVDSLEMAQTLAVEIPNAAHRLIERFWPGPLTIVLKAAKNVPEDLTQGSGTIGMRVPLNKFCIELLKRCGCPLTSTSANISGESVHSTIKEIHRALNGGIDLYIDAGILPETKPSTIVSVADHTPKLIRQGIISFEELQAVVPHIIR